MNAAGDQVSRKRIDAEHDTDHWSSAGVPAGRAVSPADVALGRVRRLDSLRINCHSTTLDVIDDAAVLIAPDLRVVALNAVANALIGEQPTGTVHAGRDVLALVHKDDRAQLANALLNSHHAAHGTTTVAARLLTGDATWSADQGQLRITALVDPDGGLDGYLLTAPGTSGAARSLALFRRMVERTGRFIGEDFFRTGTRELSAGLGVHTVIFAQLDPASRSKATTLAVWSNGEARPNFTFDVARTPFAREIRTRLTHYAADYAKHFPTDPLFELVKIGGYVGVMVHDVSGALNGVMILCHDQPFPGAADILAGLQLFSERLGAEISRIESDASARAATAKWLDVSGIIGDGLFDLDFDTGFARLTARCCELLGFPLQLADTPIRVDQILGTVHNEDAARVNREARECAVAGELCHTTARMLTASGAWRWFDVRARSKIDRRGRVTRTLGLLSDITPLRTLEQQVRDAQRMAPAHVGDGIARDGAASGATAESIETATILYIEDEAPLRVITARVLRRGGYRVIEAGGAEEALALAKDTKVDLVITDLMLPGIPPSMVCAAVLARNPQAEVMVVTGWGEIDSHTMAVAPRAQLVTKPFRSRDLAAKAAALLARSGSATSGPPLH